MPQKGSRLIVVDGIAYQWRIRRKATYCQSDYGSGRLHLSVQQADSPGTVLVIETDRPHPQDWATKTVNSVTPRDVEQWIRKARELGWTPPALGATFTVQSRGETLKTADRRRSGPPAAAADESGSNR